MNIAAVILMMLPIAMPVMAYAQSTGSTPPAPTECQAKSGSFLGLKPWYAYLKLKEKKDVKGRLDCSVDLQLSDSTTGAKNLNQLWLIAMAIFEDLLRIAALVAFGFLIYGGFRYITSQGEPENIKVSLSTIVNALIGLAIAILGAALVAFIAGRLGAS
jgi:hypothetical protein